MTLPYTTTTVLIERPSAPETDDGYSPQGWVLVASAVPAVVSNHDATERTSGGDTMKQTAKVHVAYDVDLRAYDRVTDDADGVVYRVVGVWKRDFQGISFVEARLVAFTGANDG